MAARVDVERRGHCRAEGDEVGNVRRTSLDGDLVHEHCNLELNTELDGNQWSSQGDEVMCD